MTRSLDFSGVIQRTAYTFSRLLSDKPATLRTEPQRIDLLNVGSRLAVCLRVGNIVTDKLVTI